METQKTSFGRGVIRSGAGLREGCQADRSDVDRQKEEENARAQREEKDSPLLDPRAKEKKKEDPRVNFRSPRKQRRTRNQRKILLPGRPKEKEKERTKGRDLKVDQNLRENLRTRARLM